MKRKTTVLGVTAPTIKPTAWAAFLLAVLLSVPVFAVLSLMSLLV